MTRCYIGTATAIAERVNVGVAWTSVLHWVPLLNQRILITGGVGLIGPHIAGRCKLVTWWRRRRELKAQGMVHE